MILTRDYLIRNLSEGVITADLSSWEEFSKMVTGRVLNTGNYIWRGQRSADWLLESTFDRMLKKFDNNDSLRNLKSFKIGTKGRAGLNPENTESDDDWWATGLHYGQVTPLLEWTISPFIAAYFAFCKDGNQQERRAIYAFAQSVALVINKELKIKNLGTSEDDLFVKYVNPSFDDNSSLAKQSGLFTKAPTGVDIERWVRGNFSVVSKAKVILLKLTLPSAERTTFLKALNRMNINKLTLFPSCREAPKFSNRM
ncbi:MAG: FRG domain-containing protein [Desulfosporosinus sp.]|nr:FRG domain-containing protein [Desulfosporosinus sp.]